jgi:SlyX protein
MNERLNDLEIRFMHQERTIQELNEIVCRQDHAIEQMERELHSLREQVKLILPSLNRPAEDEEPPPHY